MIVTISEINEISLQYISLDFEDKKNISTFAASKSKMDKTYAICHSFNIIC